MDRAIEERVEEEESMSDLKPCPFCGSEAVVNYKQALGTWIVECTNSYCPASYMIGMDYDTKLEAVDAWNRRPNNE